MENKTYTHGNVIVEDIKIGDIHYEYYWNVCLTVKVITLPALNSDGQYKWKSEAVSTGNIVDYLVDPKYAHYSAKLYDYEAYSGCTKI